MCYFGAGLVGELAGYAWQPRGAGNSVAICGLAGAVVVQVALGRSLLAGPPVAAAAAMVALVLLAAMDLHGAAMAAGIVIAALIGRQAASPRPEARLGAERWPPCQGRRGRSSQEERFVSCRVCRLRR